LWRLLKDSATKERKLVENCFARRKPRSFRRLQSVPRLLRLQIESLSQEIATSMCRKEELPHLEVELGRDFHRHTAAYQRDWASRVEVSPQTASKNVMCRFASEYPLAGANR